MDNRVMNFIISWYMARGSLQVFTVMAGITAAWFVLAVPHYVFGKKYRMYWFKHDFIKIWNLGTEKAGSLEA